jgi:hypothetical protein
MMEEFSTDANDPSIARKHCNEKIGAMILRSLTVDTAPNAGT